MEKQRSEFIEMLNKTEVPSSASIDEQIKAYGNLQETIKKHIPQKLFRYRSCNERSISAFDKDEIWVSSADCMNDGYDTRVFIDMEKINQWKEELVKTIPDLSFFDEVVRAQPDMQAIIQPFLNSLNAAPPEEYKKLVDQAIEKLKNDISYFSERIANSIQSTMKIGCFSEKIMSPYMWGLYADNESGFALEYDFYDTQSVEPKAYGTSRNSYIYPVIYSDKRYELPLPYAQFLIRYSSINTLLITKGVYYSNPQLATFLSNVVCPDVTVPTKAALYKSKEWEKEEEWRLFCTSNDDQGFQTSKHGVCIKKPTGLYLGRRISPINEKILRSIASEKGIPVYKMELNERVATYELNTRIITNIHE